MCPANGDIAEQRIELSNPSFQVWVSMAWRMANGDWRLINERLPRSNSTSCSQCERILASGSNVLDAETWATCRADDELFGFSTAGPLHDIDQLETWNIGCDASSNLLVRWFGSHRSEESSSPWCSDPSRFLAVPPPFDQSLGCFWLVSGICLPSAQEQCLER